MTGPRPIRSASRTAAALAAAYAAVSLVWICTSDRLVSALPVGATTMLRLNTGKGTLFVVVTSLLLYGFIRSALLREVQLREELDAEERRYRTLVEQSLAMIYIIQDGRFRYVNPRYTELLGYTLEELRTAPIDRTVAPEDLPRVRENLRRRLSGEIDQLNYSFTAVARDGRRVELDVAGTVTTIDGKPAIIGTAVDQTERNRLQREAARAQKLEILGLLAGGLAHDVANILHSIQGFAQMIERAAPAGRVREDAAEIVRCSERATVMTRQLLAFGRGRDAEAAPRDLNKVVRDCAPMLSGAVGEAVVVELGLGDRVGSVKTAPGQIEQVLLNLVVNARDAMPQGGRVRIETHAGSLPGGGSACAVLSVRDTGVGMDRATLERVFEPFFTTKGPGKGTGLGLPTVQRIAEGAGGRVEIDSAPMTGTTVRVSLPVA